MEKRGDINPAYTPPEAAACLARVQEFKQRLFSFANQKSAQDSVEQLDSDFRKNAAACAHDNLLNK